MRVTCWEALTVPTCCAAKVSEDGASASVAGAWPVPESGAVCVPTESVTVSVPFRVPEAVGAKTIPRVQLLFGASVLAQVLADTEKSPVTVSLVNVEGSPPVLAMVTYCGEDWDPTVVAVKVSEAGVSTIEAGARPVPASETVSCPPFTLPKTVSNPVRAPLCEGSKVTEIWQVPWGASDCPLQLSVSTKSPVMVRLVTLRFRLPASVRVNVCTALTVWSGWPGKVSDAGRMVAAVGAMPAVARLTCQMPRPQVAARSVWVSPWL